MLCSLFCRIFYLYIVDYIMYVYIFYVTKAIVEILVKPHLK